MLDLIRYFYRSELYYKGYVIQKTVLGYLVSDRVDRARPYVVRFSTLEAAYSYVDKATKRV